MKKDDLVVLLIGGAIVCAFVWLWLSRKDKEGYTLYRSKPGCGGVCAAGINQDYSNKDRYLESPGMYPLSTSYTREMIADARRKGYH